MKNNSILDSLKKIYVKMTGKKVVRRKTETDVLSDIAEEYDPNQGGGTTYTAGTGITITDENVINGFDGDYNHLRNQPTIPAAQIQADWNQVYTAAKDFIKNKPLIPDKVTGTYDSVSPYWHSITIGEISRNIPAPVSGTNDGTSWTSITIGDTTKAVGGGGGSIYLVSFRFLFTDSGCSQHYFNFSIYSSSIAGLPANGTEYDYEAETSDFNSVMQWLCNKFSSIQSYSLNIPCFNEAESSYDNTFTNFINSIAHYNVSGDDCYGFEVLQGYGSGDTYLQVYCLANQDDTKPWHQVSVQVCYVPV